MEDERNPIQNCTQNVKCLIFQKRLLGKKENPFFTNQTHTKIQFLVGGYLLLSMIIKKWYTRRYVDDCKIRVKKPFLISLSNPQIIPANRKPSKIDYTSKVHTISKKVSKNQELRMKKPRNTNKARKAG